MRAAPACGGGGRGISSALVAAVLLVAACREADATHFRYGSISWYPGIKARTLNQFEAVFELQMVYRKDYNWGAYFKTQWRESPKFEWKKTLNGMPPRTFDCENPGVYSDQVQCFTGKDVDVDHYDQYQVLLPVGMGAIGLDLVPNPDSRNKYLLNGAIDPLNDKENLGGRMCASPYHKGVRGDPNALVITKDMDQNFPQYEIGDLIEDPEHPERLIKVCTPWSESEGFFFGDSVTSYHSPGVVLNVQNVDHDGSLLGNAVRFLSEPISHIYPSASSGGKPWIAYMTGGNRLSTLNNNADGRFRLEIGVLFNTEPGADGRKLFLRNRSPVASTIPIMPVIYTDSFTATDGARFQIAAIDPDFGNPDLHDQVRFFIGTPEEHGGILGNPVYVPLPDNTTVQVFTWYEDYYYAFICQQGLAISSALTNNPADEICTSQIYVGRDNAQKYSNPLDPYIPLDLPVEDLYGAWNDDVNKPRPPEDLTIDPFSGFVTWQTGRDPWTPASNGVRMKAPGLYQLTVMIEERHSDQIDPDTGYDILPNGTAVFPQKDFGMKVPLDFLMYLYTPMHYCSKGCNNLGSGANMSYPKILQTFETSMGYYGDSESASSIRIDGLQGPGTGQCRLCGGGGSQHPFHGTGSYVIQYYEESVRNATQFCRVPEVLAYGTVEANLLRDGTIGTTGSTFGSIGALLNDQGLPFKWKAMTDGTLPGWRFLPEDGSGLSPNYCEAARTYYGPTTQQPALQWQGWVFQGCLGYRDNATLQLLPYDGELDSCLINTLPEFITDCTLRHPSGDCRVLDNPVGTLRTTPALGCGFRMQQGILAEKDNAWGCCGHHFPLLPVNSTNMNATQGVYPGMYTPATIEAVKGEHVTFDLVATDYDQCVELEILHTGLSQGMVLGQHERIDTRTVARTFSWGPVDSLGKTVTTADEDEREALTLVCFYAFDRYLATANPFHCVMISLAMPASIRWCDQPSGTVSPLPITADNRTLYAYLGEETCVDLCVAKRDDATTFVQTTYNLTVRSVDQEVVGLYPDPARFQYPYDQINFPPSGAWKNPSGSDPYTTKWCFVPSASEECVYTVCFQGIDLDTVYDGDYFDEKLETTNVKCFKIEVFNTVATFSGAEILEADELSAHIVPFGEDAYQSGATGGFTMAAWVWPTCAFTNINQTIMYFGTTRNYGGSLAGGDVGNEVRNGLMFHHLNSTDEELEALGYFSYHDCKIGNVYSKLQYCCQCWHYVAVTVSASGEGVLYVDGTRQGHSRYHGRDELMFDAVEFKTTSFPDNNADGDNQGIFTIGGKRGSTATSYQGHIDEVRVWNRALTNLEVLDTIYMRVPDVTDPTLKAHFHMRNEPNYTGNPPDNPTPPLADGSGTLETTGLAAAGTGALPLFSRVPIPAMVPCVLGIQHSVGPVDGECLTEVYGWSMADSNNIVCQFDGQDTRGKWLSTMSVRCVTPGHISPRFAEVKVSNDGYHFTNTTGAAKTVHHLFMESSLYTDGAGEGGVRADLVCLDLPSREMTFGGWFCPKCVAPGSPTPPPPPPPPPSPPPPTPAPTPAPTTPEPTFGG